VWIVDEKLKVQQVRLKMMDTGQGTSSCNLQLEEQAVRLNNEVLKGAKGCGWDVAGHCLGSLPAHSLLTHCALTAHSLTLGVAQ
jgi:hypothetical protein